MKKNTQRLFSVRKKRTIFDNTPGTNARQCWPSMCM